MKKGINQIPVSVKTGALHKANLIKINKINNILVLENKFNAKMDSVHYDNNKLILENSKFLNKKKNINTTSPNSLSLPSLASASLLLKAIEAKGPLKEGGRETLLIKKGNPISLNDTSLSLLAPLSKGIGAITEFLKPNFSALMAARDLSSTTQYKGEGSTNKQGLAIDSMSVKQHDFLNESNLNLNKKAESLSSLASDRLRAEANKNFSSSFNLKNRSNMEDENKLNSLNFISSCLSPLAQDLRGESISLKELPLASASLLAKGKNNKINKKIIISMPLKENNQIKNILASSGNVVKKEEQLNILNTKVEIATLNKIKVGSSITQKVYDSITLPGSLVSPTPSPSPFSTERKTKNLSLKYQIKKINQKEQNKDNTIIHKYLSNITKSNSHINTNPNLSKKYGILLNYNRSIGYTFLNKSLDLNKNTNLISEFKEETYKLLFYFFKSIYCIISKPTILFSPDKITIRLFYYLVIPKKKVFKLFAIHYLNSFRNKWMKKKGVKLIPSSVSLGKTDRPTEINYYQSPSLKKEIGLEWGTSTLFQPLGINKGMTQSPIGSDGEGREIKISSNKLNNFNSSLGESIALSNRGKNVNKIRLPFMKFKVRKVISRLKSKPTLIRKVYFYLRQFNIVKVFHNKFLLITKILSRLFNKPIVLEITRIHNFKNDSNILANAIQFVVKNKRKNPRVAIKKVYGKKNIKLLNDPNLTSFYNTNKVIAFLSGLNIYINGRLMREAIIPRMTTKKFEKGATATGKVNYIDTSYITKKNRKGAYTIKVKSAQNFL